MQIETDRLILRRWNTNDLESMYKYCKDPEIGPAAGWPAHESIDVTKNILDELIKHEYCFAICLKEDVLHPIGCVELKIDENKNDEMELGYWIGKPYWGNGYMPEASKAVMDYGFNELNLNIIWCGYYDGNTKSKRVQEKLGFIHHHTDNNKAVPALNETRISHMNIMTKERWFSL